MIKGIRVRLLSRLLLSIRLCSGCFTPFSCDAGITTPVRVWPAEEGGTGREFPPLCGIIRFGCNGVPPTEGVLAQSVNGMPISLLGAMVGTLVAGFGGAGRRLGGLLDGDVVI